MNFSSGMARPFILLVKQGRTSFPQRPIDTDRFLIGGGSNCHLRLGGDMPMLHSILIREKQQLWIDAVSPQPALRINGQPVREALVGTGDCIAIGDFEFELAKSATEEMLPPAADPESGHSSLQQLEHEVDQLDEILQGRRQGAAALCQAVRAASSIKTGNAHGSASELAQLMAQLQAGSAQLDERERALQAFEQRLQRAQQELLEQLAGLHAEQQQLPPGAQGPDTIRLSA